jgi:hypothetical protein
MLRNATYRVAGLPMSVQDRNYVLTRAFKHLDWSIVNHGPDFRDVHVRYGDGDPVNWDYVAERGLRVERLTNSSHGEEERAMNDTWLVVTILDEGLTARAQDVINAQGIGVVMVDDDEIEIRGDADDVKAALDILRRHGIPFRREDLFF